MKTIPPFPDEFVLGHLTRLTAANSATTPAELQKAFGKKKWVGRYPPYGQFKYLAELLHGLDLSVKEYQQRHILLPLTAPTQMKAYAHRGGYLKDEFILHHFPMGFIAYEEQTPWKFCPTCRTLDRAKYGISYWHRSHQVPGIDLCHLHDEALHYCDVASIFLDPTLSNLEKLHITTPSPELIAASQIPGIVLYRSIVNELLVNPLDRGYSRKKSLDLLRQERMEAELRSRKICLPLLSSVLSRSEIPDAWIVKHFPLIAQRWAPEGKFVNESWRSEFLNTEWHKSDLAKTKIWSIGLELLLACLEIRNRETIQTILWPETYRYNPFSDIYYCRAKRKNIVRSR